MSTPWSVLNFETTLPQAIIDRQSDVNLRTAAIAVFALVNPTFDVSEGSDVWALLAPFAIVLAEAYGDLVEIERRTSLATATGRSLDLLGELYGVPRGPAAYAYGTVEVRGIPGSVIPVGMTFSTQGPQARFFQMTSSTALTLPASGVLALAVRASATGAAGNVPAGAVILFGTLPVPQGLQTVTNPEPMRGGADIQPDGPVGQFNTGYRADIWRLMDARGEGGAAKHYRKWARQVPGVGGVTVLETTPRPGWVTIALLGNDGKPADAAVVHAVEAFILDPWYLSYEAEDLPSTGGTPSSQPDGTPPAPAYNTLQLGAGGAVIHTALETVLPQPGIWRLKARVKGSGTIEARVINLASGQPATTRPTGLGDPAVQSITVNWNAFRDLTLDWWQDFAWDGPQMRLEARITRTAGTVYVDQVAYWATMSRADRDLGLSPAGARLLVKPADGVVVNVAANIAYALQSGQTSTSVGAAIAQRLTDYFASIAFVQDATVRRAAIENVIFDTPGVSDVNNVTLNGSTANLPIAPDAVATLGTTSWS